MLADYLSSMQARTFSKLSAIELADIQIPGQFVARCKRNEFINNDIDRDLNSGYDAMVGIEESGSAV